jgi:hypothetical protein
VSRPGPRSLSPSRPPISRGPSRSPILPRSLFLSHWLVPTLDREPKGALHTHKRTKTNRHSTALGTPCCPPASLLVATPCAAGCAPPGNNHVPLAAVATVRSLQTAAVRLQRCPATVAKAPHTQQLPKPVAQARTAMDRVVVRQHKRTHPACASRPASAVSLSSCRGTCDQAVLNRRTQQAALCLIQTSTIRCRLDCVSWPIRPLLHACWARRALANAARPLSDESAALARGNTTAASAAAGSRRRVPVAAMPTTLCLATPHP